LIFCNKPNLTLDSLGEEDDLNNDTLIEGEIDSSMAATVAKALYRRGKCFQHLDKPVKAREDWKLAQTYAPEDKVCTYFKLFLFSVYIYQLLLLNNRNIANSACD
jgi:hypothetical protein